MATLETATQASDAPVLVVSTDNHLKFISAVNHQVLKSVSYSHSFQYTCFSGRTYVVQSTGQVDIFDTATQVLQESISATGLARLTTLLVFPSRIYSMHAGFYLIFGSNTWEKMQNPDVADAIGNGQSCMLDGQTYVAMSQRKPNPCTWCGNCIGTYVYESSLFLLDGATDLNRVKVDLRHGSEAPFLLPYPPGRIVIIGGGWLGPESTIYQYRAKGKKLKTLGEIEVRSFVESACISGDQLYAVYEDGSYLSVSLKTGMGRFVSARMKEFLWWVSKKMPRLTQSVLKEIMKEFLHMKHLRF
jgi:hypothetical protein